MLYKLVIQVALLLFLAGCGSTNIYVIDKQDYYEIKQGTQIGNTTVDRHGYFLSDLYMTKVAEAKVKRSK
jgi:uncharacterized protein YceK